MHFCVSTTRGGFHEGFCCARKIGTNWFIPAFVNSRLGASGSKGDDGTMVCCFSRKKSRHDCRISADVMGNHELTRISGNLKPPAQIAVDSPPRRDSFFGGRFYLVVKPFVVLQSFLRSIPALGKLRPFVIQPRTPLFDDLLF